MTAGLIDHVDEHGAPCPHHRQVTLDALLALATIGARVPSFHHDTASKLQSLMMALDELDEQLADLPDALAVTATAQTALRELHALMTQNRALVKAPQRARMLLDEIVRQGAERFGVRLRGELGDTAVDVAAPAAIQALGSLLDLAAGGGAQGRTVEVTATIAGDHTMLALVGPPPTAASGNAAAATLAIATYVFDRDGGAMWCADGGRRLVVKLPLAKRTP